MCLLERGGAWTPGGRGSESQTKARDWASNSEGLYGDDSPGSMSSMALQMEASGHLTLFGRANG